MTDSREVSVSSTLHTAFAVDTVKRVCKVNGKHTAVEVLVLSTVKDYIHFIGGVDLSDQLTDSYSS